jgi:nitric oxide reductase NorD protein
MSPARSSADARADALAARVACGSRIVAEEFRRRWPAAVAALGTEAAGAWGDLGAALLEGVGTGSGAALAYFRSAPLTTHAAARGAWVGAALRIAAVSPALAASFCEATVGLIATVPTDAIEGYASEAIRLRTERGWRGERLAHLFVNAAPIGLTHLGVRQFAVWHEVVVAVASVVPEAQAFRDLPVVVAQWTDAERDDWLGWALALAARRPAAGWVVYRDAPRALAGVVAGERSPLLASCRPAGAVADPTAQESLVPMLGALVLAVPPADRPAALAYLATIAVEFPAAVPGFLRVIGRLHEDARPEQIAEWVAYGLGLAAPHPAAALAFFGLESRTSRRVLRASPTSVALEDVQGVARRFIHMLSGRTIVLRGEGGLRLGLPLEPDQQDGGVLPAQIDGRATAEDHQRIYRGLAALLAARRTYGTYDDPTVVAAVQDDERGTLGPCFRLADGYRVAVRLAARYPGLATELEWLGRELVAHWASVTVPDPAMVCDGLLAVLLAGTALPVPAWLAAAATVAAASGRKTGKATATAADALVVAHLLATVVPFPAAGVATDAELSEYARFMLELGGGEDAFPPAGSEEGGGALGPAGNDDDPPAPTAPDLKFDVDELLDEMVSGGRPLTADELARLVEAGVMAKLSQVEGLTPQQAGLYVTQLVGKLMATPQLRAAVRPDRHAAARPRRAPVSEASPVYRYDEWDHEIADYRPGWCQLREVALADDAGVFFTQTLERHAALVPEIRRHFQRVLPETYRPVRGLEDGEDFDLNAVIDARVQRRAGHAAPSKLYSARIRQEREVATLFLLDMSASTDESPPSGEGRRIIDIAKEALVLMAAALDEIGDACAIYGFSGQGHEQVEVYPVKDFNERLSPAVKGRIGGIEPKGSTRMGTALRHVLTKMQRVTAPSRHVVLLSDGFPQDLDYGRDRHSHLYGIRDTAMALREVDAAGVKPFCITVDLAGHDYLRTMCDPHRYLVIERLVDLPRELPKIYQRLVRAA